MNSTGIFEAALAIAIRRRETLDKLKSALEKGQDAEALRIARYFVGLEHEEPGTAAWPQ